MGIEVRIARVTIQNYKCFDQAGPIEFGPGINVLCGQNNAGKTALLEVLEARFDSRPHRSLRTMGQRGDQLNPESSAVFTVSLTRPELFRLLRQAGPAEYFLASPHYTPETIKAKWGLVDNPTFVRRFLDEIFAPDEFSLRFKIVCQPSQRAVVHDRIPSIGDYPAPVRQGHSIACIQFALRNDRPIVTQDSVTVPTSNELGVVAGAHLMPRIYRFKSERYNVGECPFGSNELLAPDASNLPEVLGVMQANHERFIRFNEEVRAIFPQITRVSVGPKADKRQEIVVWQHDPATERDDLAVPLSECGTGIGQVLAILYVMLSRSQPGVILIDEPQSFLHPGALRKLIQVVREHPEHQVILATHSPGVMACAEPSSVTMLKIEAGVASLHSLSAADSADLRSVLAELGARLSDVFGADRVLWVEGPTEERCVPLVLDGLAKSRLAGTAILGIRRTGELQGRDAEKIFEIYRRLSAGPGLMPPAVGFIFDRECRTEDQMTDLRRSSRGLVTFLPCRMFENYLLHPAAIANLCNSIQGFREQRIAEEEVGGLIDSHCANAAYFCHHVLPEEGSARRGEVDAARLLGDLFSSLSENRVSYDKVKHGEALTKWLIAHEPGHLKDLAEFYVGVLDGKRPVPA